MLPVKYYSIWPSGFRGEDFFMYQPIRNKNRPWRPCFLSDRDKMSNRCSLHRCSQLNWIKFCPVVSEKMIKMWIVKRRTERRLMKDAKWRQKLTWPLARWAKNLSKQRKGMIWKNEYQKSITWKCRIPGNHNKTARKFNAKIMRSGNLFTIVL